MLGILNITLMSLLDRPNTLRPGTFVSEVRRLRTISPRIREITIAGGLDDYRPLGPDQFVYVLAPPADRRELTVGTDFSWEQYRAMPAVDRPIGAYYSVRRFRPAGAHGPAEIDLWAVLHGCGRGGAYWAERVDVGDPVAVWGPREATTLPAGLAQIVLVGDETALGAIGSILDSLDPRTDAIVVIEADGDPIELPLPPSHELRWIGRQGAAPGTTDGLFVEVAGLLPRLGADTFVFAAGEAAAMSDLRRLLASGPVGPERTSVTAYWRRR